MECRQGFDEAAALKMLEVQGTPAENHVERCRNGLFWALYHDGKPAGGILIERGLLHVSSAYPCGFIVRKVIMNYLQNHEELIAPILPDNSRARKLAEGMGFRVAGSIDGFLIYRRHR